MAAGAHTEGKGGAAVGQMAGQLVVGGRQLVPERAVLGLGDELLLVLDPHTDGKALLLHGHPLLLQHPEGIPGRVAGRQHQGVTVQAVAPLRSLHPNAAELSAAVFQSGEAAAKAHVTAQGDELLTDGFHHLAQNIGTDVGLVGPLHILWRSRFNEGVHHRGNTGVVGPGGQLAVGEGACTSFAKLHIGAGVQSALLPEPLHIFGSGIHILAPLQHHAGNPVPGQKQGGKQARRPHSSHHRHVGGTALHLRERIRDRMDQGDVAGRAGRQHRLLLLHFHIQGIHIVYILLFPCVDGLTHQPHLLQCPGTQPQRPGRFAAQLFQTPAHRQGNILNPYHVITRPQCTIPPPFLKACFFSVFPSFCSENFTRRYKA